MPKPTIATETHVTELLAFNLFRLKRTDLEVPPRGEAVEITQEVWRQSPTLRETVRQQAKNLLQVLRDTGLRLAVSDSSKVLRTIDDIITIPSHPAYDLEGGSPAETDTPSAPLVPSGNPQMRNLTQPKAAYEVDRSQIALATTPVNTETHHPLPHIAFLEEVEHQLAVSSFEVAKAKHMLTPDGSRYFGVLDLQSTQARGYSFVVGLRNSHDKSFAAAVAAGNRVFVCDNLCFYGEIKLERKHTRFAARDLPQLTARVVGQLAPLFGHAERRIEAYQETDLNEAQSDHLILAALRAQAITGREVVSVMEAYAKPEHEEFSARSVWGLFNAITGVHREIRDDRTLVRRGEALHGVFDGFCGLQRFVANEE